MDLPEILRHERFAELVLYREIVGVEIVEDREGYRAVVLKLAARPAIGEIPADEQRTLTIFAPPGGYDGETELQLFEGRVAQWGDVDLPS